MSIHFHIRVALAFLVLLPFPAAAQKESFRDAFIDFHSALAGSYGDEGAEAAAALGRLEGSLTAWERAQLKTEGELKARPGITPAELALFYADEGRFDDATNAMAAAISREPTRASLYIFHGLLQEAAGRHTDASAAFATAGATTPTDPVALYLAATRNRDAAPPEQLHPLVTLLIAAVERRTAPGQKAPFVQFQLIKDSSSRVPVFAPAAYADGFELFTNGRWRDALTRLRTALAQDPLLTDPASRHQQALAGITALREKRGAAAVEQLEAAVKALPNSAEAHRALGVTYRALARLPESISHLEAAMRLTPRDERTRVTLGATLAEAGELADAERVLRETVGMLPASGSARWALADVYERLNRGLDAIATLEEAAMLTVVAGKSALYWRIAQLAHRHQDFERVVTALSRRVRLLPNEAYAHKDLGLAYARIGRDDEALIELLMTTVLGVEDAETLTAIGQIHLNADRFDAAEAALRRVVKLDPAYSQARYALGTTLLRIGKSAEGKQQLDEFQRLRTAALDEQRRKFETPTKPDGASAK